MMHTPGAVFAQAFGLSPAADVFWAAFRVPSTVRNLLGEVLS